MTVPCRIRPVARRLLVVAAAVALVPTVGSAQSLRGSAASLDRQNDQARLHDFTYISTSAQVRRFVESGYLVPVRGNRDFELHAVSFPYARPEAELFIRRLAAQYRAACGEKLVVTSLTRPQSRQPRNASDRSVHPTGMAIDLRYSGSRACRSWLEGVLLSLEETGVLEATRERYPAHYHIALFPQPYAAYVAALDVPDRAAELDVPDRAAELDVPDRTAELDAPDRSTEIEAPARVAAPAQRVAQAAPSIQRYEVRRGDSLWTIARAHGVSVAEIRSSNDLSSSRIYAGQVLRVPVRTQR